MTAFANMSYVQFGSDRKDNLLGFQSHVWHDDIVLQTSICRSSICWSVRYSTQKFHFAMPLCQMPPKTGNPNTSPNFTTCLMGSRVPSPSFLESLSQNVIVETQIYIYICIYWIPRIYLYSEFFQGSAPPQPSYLRQ